LAAAQSEPKKLLILGGTGEAAALAGRLAEDPRLTVITSLAGRTRDPAKVAGTVRVGGFGGAVGLATYLDEESISLLIDATHPFAAQITANAAAACSAAEVPRLILTRPPWRPQTNDRWVRVPNAQAAAGVLADLGRRVFLSAGRQDLAPFADLQGIWFLVRVIDDPAEPLALANCEVILGRGPFAAEDEAALMQAHGIAVLVSKNSGGQATYGKIEAARRLGLPVVMIDRPALPKGLLVQSVDEAAAWAESQCTLGPEPPEFHA